MNCSNSNCVAAIDANYFRRVVSEKLKYVERIVFWTALEFHFESIVSVSMQPAALVDIFRANCDEPVLTVAQIRAKLHDHVRELVQVGPGAEIRNCFVFEH